MNALKRIIVLGAVFFIGFSFVAFGKITYQDTTTEIRNITNNNNGKTAKNELEPFIYKDRTWVPIQFISENMGKYIEWNGKTNTIDTWNQKPESKMPQSEEGKNEIASYSTGIGAKYHRGFCSDILQNKIPISLKDSEAQYYTFCGLEDRKNCHYLKIEIQEMKVCW